MYLSLYNLFKNMNKLYMNEYIFKNSEESLSSQKKKIEEIINQFHSELNNLLINGIKNPSGRMSLAELINSYSQLHKVLIDINKQLIEIPHKQIELDKKRKDLEIENDLNKKLSVFDLQKIYSIILQKDEQI